MWAVGEIGMGLGDVLGNRVVYLFRYPSRDASLKVSHWYPSRDTLSLKASHRYPSGTLSIKASRLVSLVVTSSLRASPVFFLCNL